MTHLRYWSQILICQNPKLQIPIVMVYKTLDVQLTKSNILVLWWKSHDNTFNPDSYFFFGRLLKLYPKCAKQCPTHTALCTSWFCTWYIFLSFFHIFSRIYLSTKITYVAMSFTLPQRLRAYPEGFQKSFFADHEQWWYMRTEQYYQRSFVILPTILEATTTG